MILISLRLVIELKFTGIGQVVSLLTSEHFDAKELLKWLAFSLKFYSSVLSISNGGIKGILLIQEVFNIDQYVFELGERSASF